MGSLDLKYIRVTQKNSSFFLSKAFAYELRDKVDFHFREPYSNLAQHKTKAFDSLKRTLESNDISFDDSPKDNGIQRMLQNKRVYEIRDFIENSESSIFPSTVLLAIDTSQCAEEIPYLNESGVFTLRDDMHVSIIDGQHRLAGLFLASEKRQREMEVPIIFMLDIDTPTAALLFQQINGKQKPVSKSIIFDLFDSVPNDRLSNKNDQLTKEYHTICKSLNADISSPLFRQIKMLGTGGGAISQACFIETCKRELSFMDGWELQSRYDVLFGYLSLLQNTFPEDWPVPLNASNLSFDELDHWSKEVLYNRKSQLMKTNGFSAVIQLLDYLYENEIALDSIELLKGQIDWTESFGTGAAAQNKLFIKLKEIIEQNRAQELSETTPFSSGTIAELLDIVEPIIGTDIGNDGFIFGNYVEWPKLESLDDDTLISIAETINLACDVENFDRTATITALRKAGMPETTLYEDAGQMKNYPIELLYWSE